MQLLVELIRWRNQANKIAFQRQQPGHFSFNNRWIIQRELLYLEYLLDDYKPFFGLSSLEDLSGGAGGGVGGIY